jgi:hypothetical protein
VVLKRTAKKYEESWHSIGVLGPEKGRVQLNGLHGVISQKMILFKTGFVLKTSQGKSMYAFFYSTKNTREC